LLQPTTICENLDGEMPLNPAKKLVLDFIERHGYVLLKQLDWQQKEQHAASAVQQARAELAEWRLKEVDWQQKEQRAAREVEQARAEVSDNQQKARLEIDKVRSELAQALEQQQHLDNERQQARTEAREFRDRLTQALDEIRRLKIRVEETPEIDYQVLMKHQHEKAQFQDADPAFLSLYERTRQFSMTSIERLYAMHKATEYVSKAGISGSIVESGVWRGGSMMMAALTLKGLGDTQRKLILFDTFEGLPKPNQSEDIDLWGHSAYNEWTRHRRTDTSSDWAFASLEEVRENMLSTGYPVENIVLIKGMVQDTLPLHVPDSIALLRLDTDWYESTACELDHLYSALSMKGVLIIDDYGHLRGQRKAVDEFLVRSGKSLLLVRVDYSGRVVVKTA
jgi:Macrocin-O-methyltransferase (TylF)